MRNLGPKSLAMLAEIGIRSLEDLKQVGVIATFRAAQELDSKVTMNLLWSLEGALSDRDWREITSKRKLELLRQLDADE